MLQYYNGNINILSSIFKIDTIVGFVLYYYMNLVNLLFFQKVNLWDHKFTQTKQKIAQYLITRGWSMVMLDGWSMVMLDVEVPLGKIVKAIKNEP